jgi:hypothetical protein
MVQWPRWHAQVDGRFSWLASPDPIVPVPTHCNLQIGLQNAAIFGPGVVRCADGNTLSFNGLQMRLVFGSRVALTSGCPVQRRRVF